MRKTLIQLVIGAVAGAVVMLVVIGRRDPAGSPTGTGISLLDSVVAFGRGKADAAASADVSIEQRLRLFREAEQATDPASLRDRLAAAAARDFSPARDAEIDALLVRLADLNPGYAAELSVSLALDPAFVAAAYGYWAEADTDAALAGLGTLGNSALRREIALSLLDVLGDDNRSVDAVAAALPPSERDGFRIEWLRQRTAYDPFGAFRDAEALSEPSAQRRALAAVGAAWAAVDPQSAMRQADALLGDAAQGFRGAVAREWARLDADAFLSYLTSVPQPSLDLVSAARLALIGDPARALQIAASVSGQSGELMRQMALTALAESDPEAAMARAGALPPGNERNMLLQSIGSALARKDPQAAVAWARELSPPSPDVQRTVALAIASTDVIAALDLIDDPGFGIESQLVLSMLSSRAGRNGQDTRVLADKLRAREDVQSAAALRGVVANWMQSDPETALAWVFANDSQVDRSVLNGAAQAMAERDPEMAAEFVSRIPLEYRDGWISQVAAQYGRYDPRAAMSWIAQFQGTDSYDIAARQLIVNAARSDPRAAAEFMSQASPDVQIGAASTVASQWAQQEPRAAAAWALDIGEPRARTMAIGSAVGGWLNTDPAAARNWTLNLRRGEPRDQALQNVMMFDATAGEFDAGLLNAFDNETAKNTALRNSLTMLARIEPDRARDILEREVDDANMRVEIGQQIDQLGQANAAAPVILF